jgi:hypothetical protein
VQVTNTNAAALGAAELVSLPVKTATSAAVLDTWFLRMNATQAKEFLPIVIVGVLLVASPLPRALYRLAVVWFHRGKTGNEWSNLFLSHGVSVRH